MTYKTLIDSSFIPSEYYQIDTYSDMYQIAYGVILRKPSFERTHDIVVRLAKETKSILMLKVKLHLWELELDRIIKKLKSYQKPNLHVEVVIPFTSYSESLEVTLMQYEFANTIIRELANNISLLDKEEIKDGTIVPPMYSLFADYILDFQERFIDDSYVDEKGMVVGTTLRDCYSIIIDEVLRRGLRDGRKFYESCSLIANIPPYTPSKMYDNENLFVELFINKEEILSGNELVSLPKETSEEEKRMEDNKKIRCGVLYYTLNDHLDDYSLSAIINYCCNVPYNNRIKKKNTNSIDKYIRLYRKRDLSPTTFDSFDLKPDAIKDIKGVLSEYELPIPQTLQEEE